MGEQTAFRDFARRLAGDSEPSERDAAARELLARYAARLIALARVQMSPRLQMKVAPEDVLQSVLRTFFRRLDAGQVELRGWAGLWGFLSLATLRKCQTNAARYATASRDVAKEVSLAVEHGGSWELYVPDREPTPDEAAAFLDELESLLSGIDTRDREAVERVLAGESLPAAAAAARRPQRSVRRVFELVRKRLAARLAEPRHG